MSRRLTAFARMSLMSVLVAGSLATGCATREPGEAWDPLEVPNRFMFAINRTIDTFLLRPVTVAYREAVPQPVRNGVHNALANLGEPITALSEIAQGEPSRAATTIARFIVNSTVGFLGLFDVAKEIGLAPSKEDFGQTIGVWAKAPPEDGGPYLVLPLLGPSNARDAVGLLVDYLADPFRIVTRELDVEYLMYIRTGAHAVDVRSRTLQALDDIEKNSLDYYSAIRSAYTQKRAADIRHKGALVSSTAPLSSPGRAEIGLAR